MMERSTQAIRSVRATILLVVAAAALCAAASASKPLPAEMRILERSGFEPAENLRHFRAARIGRDLVYFRQRRIGQAVVAGDYVSYQFDAKTGRFRDFRMNWREGLPEHPPATIPQSQAEQIAGGRIRSAQLCYLPEDSPVFPIEPAPDGPCWVVYHEDARGQLRGTVVDAVTGDILGPAVPPPAEAFSFTGPIDLSQCDDGWHTWYERAATSFRNLGYDTATALRPDEATLRSHIQSDQTALLYEIAHGGSTSFTNHCGDTTTAGEVAAWIADYAKMPFVFLASCSGMCSVGPGTFRQAFLKNSDEDGVVIGYCGMDRSPCEPSCWYTESVRWQDRLFLYVGQGMTVWEAYEKANLDFPGCGANACMRFEGDRQLKLVPQVARVPIPPAILFVDGSAAGAGTGASWADAFTSLSDALKHSGPGTEILIAAGTYRPSDTGDLRASFLVEHGEQLFGGFPAGGGDWKVRDPAANPTILSGDLNGDDGQDWANRLDNSYHVVHIPAGSDRPLFDGLTIRGGHAVGHDFGQTTGGGAYIQSDAAFKNCRFEANSAALGGALGTGPSAGEILHITLEDCVLTSNRALQNGGGLWLEDSAAEITGSHLHGNTADNTGGALYAAAGLPIQLEQCRIEANQAGESGAGCFFADGQAALHRCLLILNHAETAAAAVDTDGTTLEIVNCTVTDNTAPLLPGIRQSDGSLRLLHSILWDNQNPGQPTPATQLLAEAAAEIDYNCIQGWTAAGIGNFDAGPLFVDPQAGDYHLQSSGWRWDDPAGAWTQDAQTSPCIDAGNPGMGIGNERTLSPAGRDAAFNPRINLGAYGGTAYASLAPPGGSLAADISNDGRADVGDLAFISRLWSPAETLESPADLNRDGWVDLLDVAVLVGEWTAAR